MSTNATTLPPCPLCQWTPDPSTHLTSPSDTPKAIRTHLRMTHPNANINNLPPQFLTAYNLHHCTTCNTPKFLYLRATHLHQHNKTCHDPYRDTCNTDIIASTLPTLSPTHATQWQQSIRWLITLPIRPTPFRTTLRRHISPQTLKLTHIHFHHITQWIVAASKPHRPTNTQATNMANHPRQLLEAPLPV